MSVRQGGLSKWGVRNQIERWKRSRLVRTERALGDTWVTLTRHGLDRVGLSYPTWAVPVTRVAHCHAVNIVRLWWESLPQSAVSPWISERETYKERGKTGTWHVPDGVVRDWKVPADGPTEHIAIEVELTHKSRRAYRDEVLGNLRAGVKAVSFFVPDPAFQERLRTDVATVLGELGSQRRFKVDLLPRVPGTTYEAGVDRRGKRNDNGKRPEGK